MLAPRATDGQHLLSDAFLVPQVFKFLVASLTKWEELEPLVSPALVRLLEAALRAADRSTAPAGYLQVRVQASDSWWCQSVPVCAPVSSCSSGQASGSHLLLHANLPCS